MKTVQQALLLLSESLQANNIDYPDRQAEDLLCDLLSLSRAHLFCNKEKLLTEQEWQDCQVRLQKRLRGMPLQYIHGKVDFYGCTIKVNSNVLIPRQETEILVDEIARALKGKDLKGQSLWDVCCGSGCMGIALKKQFPDLQVCLSDLSAEVMEVAQENAKLNQVDIHFFQGDLLEPFKNQKTHYFVCNPPYISREEYEKLEKEVRDYEPSQALLGGETGLEFYKRLAKELPNYLFPEAYIWLEIGYNQGLAVCELFAGSSWREQQLKKDWSGHDRFFSCRSNLMVEPDFLVVW